MTASSGATALVYVSVLVTAAYLFVLSACVVLTLFISWREQRERDRDREVGSFDSLRSSAFTAPVSVIAPVFEEEDVVLAAVRSLLALSYPVMEVIVVDDGSTDDTLATLIAAFDLKPRQVFVRNRLVAKPPKAIYRSESEPRLLVVAKDNGGKADALNCGINLARYRYLCCVDGDSVFSPDALLSAMSVIARDPERNVGATSLLGVSRHPETNGLCAHGTARIDHHLLTQFQHLDLLRAFVVYRAAWTRLDCMLCIAGCFAVWRRDVIVEMGGFSSAFTCEDIEMTFRIHERLRRERRPYRIVSLPTMVAQTEGPTSVRDLVNQRARWQRVTMETLWHYRRMLARPSYGLVGLVAMPWYLLSEGIAPFLQLLSLLTLAAAAAYGIIGWWTYLFFVGLLIWAMAIPNTVAILLHDAGFRHYRLTSLVRMLALGPLDFIAYRPIIAYAGARGVWEFLRGRKDWNKSRRNARASPAAIVRALMLPTLLCTAPARLRPQSVGAKTDTIVARAYAELQAGRAGRAEQLVERARSLSPDNADVLVVEALTERRMNERTAALSSIKRAMQLAPDRPEIQRLHRQMRQEAEGFEVTFGGGFEQWGEAAEPKPQQQLSVRRNWGRGTGVVRLSHIQQLALRDEIVDVEAYPLLGLSYAALSAGFSRVATLYPRQRAGVELFRPFANRFEGSIGWQYLGFDQPVRRFAGALGRYEGNYLFVARYLAMRGGSVGHSAALMARRYLSDGEQFVALRIAIGQAREDAWTEEDLITSSKPAVGISAELLAAQQRVVITFGATGGHSGTPGSVMIDQRVAFFGLGRRF